MKKLSFLIVSILLVISFKSFSQGCAYFYPLKASAGIEMSNYNASDKLTGSTLSKVTSVTSQAAGTLAKIHAESFDADKKSTGVVDYDVTCSGTSISIDTRSMLNQEMLKGYKDMDVKIEASELEVPSNIAVGTVLKDASLTMNVAMNGMQMTTMTFIYKNRKVVGSKSITTPAGTFECLKITFDVVMESSTMGISMKVNSSVVEYVSKNVGTVRSETIDEKNRLMGYSVLTKLF